MGISELRVAQRANLISRQAAKSAKFFYGVMHGRTFYLAAWRFGVSQALEYGTADWANGFILPIL
jgi:hypothetical protein